MSINVIQGSAQPGTNAMPTIEEITNLYLYGQSTSPSSLTDESLIRESNETTLRQVDISAYMAGPGRFALPVLFEIIQMFFNGEGTLGPGAYFKQTIAANFWGWTADPDHFYGLNIEQSFHDDGGGDYLERAYIWNNTSFKISDETLFVIGEDGSRWIENLGIEPIGGDDFNFESGLVGEIANFFLEPRIDPSGIGRTVDIQFVGDTPTIEQYTQWNYDQDAQRPSTYDPTLITRFESAFDITDQLFSSGVTRFLDANNRPIIYGTNEGDILYLDRLRVAQIDHSLTAHPYLGQYASNGVVGIGGDGDDRIYGVSTNDVIYGGIGNDTIDGAGGADTMYGGSDDDTYVIDEEGDEVVELANEGKDTVRSSIDYSLGDNVERLELVGSDDLIGIGNELDNVIKGNSGGNYIEGHGGADEIHGEDGDDIILGGDGRDQIFGGDDADTLFGDGEADDLYGQDGEDHLDGGSGGDYLDGGANADRLEGGEGDDLYRADSQDTIMDSDGSGRVHMDGYGTLTGGTRKEEDPENEYRSGNIVYVLNGTTLTINNGLTIEQFSRGQLGIFLETEPDDEEEKPDTSDAEQRTSPIVIDLDGDGVETLGLTRNRYFDHDANGMQERTAWAGSDDGFLVRDLNGNGRIDNGREMFGNHTLLSDGGVAANGFEALRDIDDNQDGRLDVNDVAFAQLRIWRDANSNGVTDAGELLTLEQAGISAVRTQWQTSTFVDANGQAHGQIGSAVRTDGSNAAAADVWFEVDAAHRINVQPIVFSPDLANLPEAKGFGNLVDLHQAMASDSVLQGLVEDFAAATDPVARDAMVEGLIFQWAGVANVDPNSRDPRMVYGHVMDARQLIVLEQLVGRGYEGTWCWGERDPNPHGAAAPLLIAEFKEFQQYVRAQLLAQIDPGNYTFVKGGFGSGYSSVKIDWVAFQQAAGALRDSGDVDKLIEIIGVVRDLGTYSPLFRTRTAQAFADLQATYPDLAPLFDTASLIGTIGNDNLFGGSQGEVIVADKGDDTLYGGGGNDSYYYRVGDGKDRIYDSSGVDQLVFMSGIVASDVTVGRDLTSILISVTVGAVLGEIRIDNVFDENGHLREGVIESIKFQDGTIWTLQDMLSRIVLPITQGDDVLYGSIVADTISAQGGNDRLLGLDGNDLLNGEAGDDILVGGNGNDVLEGGSGNDQLNGGAGNDTYLFAAGFGQDVIENYDDQTQRLDTIVFAAGIDPGDVTLTRSGNDLLLSFATGDSIRVRSHYNGDGNSRYSINEVHFADGTVWNATTLNSMALGGTTGNDTLIGYESDDIVLGLGGNDYISGGAGNDQLSGNEGDDRLSGDAGNDYLVGGAGLDQLTGGDGDDVLDGGADRDSLYGGYGADQLLGGDADDNLYGEAGDDQLVGGLGNDRLEGGYGDDRYYFARGDGTDTISDIGGQSTIYVSNLPLAEVYFRRDGSSLVIRFTSSANDEIRLERFFDPVTGLALSGIRIDSGDGQPWDVTPSVLDAEVLKATSLDDTINGNTLDNVIDGLAGNDVIRGHDGVDQISGGIGDDRLYGDAGNDVLIGGVGIDLLDGGTGDDQLDGSDGNDNLSGGEGTDNLLGGQGDDLLAGGAGADTLTGEEGHDVLDGGLGADQMTGGSGNDEYRVDDANDIVIEALGEGIDIVRSSVSYTLPTNVETLELTGSDAIDATGDGTSNHLIGNSANNILSGLAGNDVLEGGGGQDVLIGGAGNDLLDGGYDVDRLEGGTGDDEYVVDTQTDLVVELADEGQDTVRARSDYTLSDHIETLILDEAYGAYRGTGNSGDNLITGNSSSNYLDGAGGADQLVGGLGDDIYVVDSASDQVVEQADEGEDTVQSSVNYVLGSTLENLTLLGDDNLNGTGNDQANVLRGNTGNNRLDGGAGGDDLYGGEGDDYLINDSSGDWIYEYQGEGLDTIERRYETNLVLSNNVENLILATGVTTGHGNNLDNVITGNAGANSSLGLDGIDQIYGLDGNDSMWGGVGADQLFGGNGDDYMEGDEDDDYLEGGAGHDQMEGGAGIDTLIGGTGDDKYIAGAGAGTGTDLVDNTGGGFDGIFFREGVTAEQLVFTRDGDDLLIAVTGQSAPAIRVQNHFLGGDAAIDYVQPDGGFYLTTAQINQIVAGGGTGGEFDQVIEGTASGEQLVGSAGKDLIKGLAGDDTLFGMGGNDTLQGGDGADYLAGGNGSGTGSGADRLEGGAGNDTLSGEDGANTLVGGTGDDSYVYGGGQDTIDNTGGGFDGVFFNDGLLAGDLAFAQDGDDLVITVDGNASATVRVTDHFLGGDYALDFVQPDSGNMLDTAAINALVAGGGGDPGGGGNEGNDGDYANVVTGTASGEQLLGTSGRDLIRGLAGDDTLFGFGGDDKFEGGDGNDYISGGNGSFSGSGSDILIGGAGSDTLVGEDGSDMLIGGTGDDDYYYSAGSGSDTIDNTGGGTDWVFFNGIASNRLSFHQDGDDLIIRVDADAAQQVRVLDHFLGGQYAISYVQPDGGNAISASSIAGQLTPLQSGAQSSRTTGGNLSPSSDSVHLASGWERHSRPGGEFASVAEEEVLERQVAILAVLETAEDPNFSTDDMHTTGGNHGLIAHKPLISVTNPADVLTRWKPMYWDEETTPDWRHFERTDRHRSRYAAEIFENQRQNSVHTRGNTELDTLIAMMAGFPTERADASYTMLSSHVQRHDLLTMPMA